jgi:RNA polymerase sigma factor (sigma-70 family)
VPIESSDAPSIDWDQLKARCIENDENAWRELMTRLYSPLFYFARTHFRLDEKTAEDLTQNAFIKLCQKISEVQHIQSWIYRVMRNLCIDHLRKKTPILMAELPELPYHETDNALDRQELFFLLRQSLNSLSHHCRDLLRFRFLESESQRDIGLKMDQPYNQIPMQQSRCLKKLKEILEKEHPHIWESLQNL